MLLAGVHDEGEPAKRQADENQNDEKNRSLLIETGGGDLTILVALRTKHDSFPYFKYRTANPCGVLR